VLRLNYEALRGEALPPALPLGPVRAEALPPPPSVSRGRWVPAGGG
jgi:hypothetical protein